MKSKIFSYLSFFFTTLYLNIFKNIPKTISKLKCEPDFKSFGDNYNCEDDPQDLTEYLYGYEFAHRAKVGNGNEEYYDKWKGIYWDDEIFCYESYNNITRPTDDNLKPLEAAKIQVLSDLDTIPDDPDSSYVIIEHDKTNLVN